METSKLRTDVVGVGYRGQFRADEYAMLDDGLQVAVVDTNIPMAQTIADKLGVQALIEHHELLGMVNTVSIAKPTATHHPIARDFLEYNCHVLIEKPITVTADEADNLIELALPHDCVLQVGHLEHFNAALRNLGGTLETPTFIESHRLSTNPVQTPAKSTTRSPRHLQSSCERTR